MCWKPPRSAYRAHFHRGSSLCVSLAQDSFSGFSFSKPAEPASGGGGGFGGGFSFNSGAQTMLRRPLFRQPGHVIRLLVLLLLDPIAPSSCTKRSLCAFLRDDLIIAIGFLTRCDDLMICTCVLPTRRRRLRVAVRRRLAARHGGRQQAGRAKGGAVFHLLSARAFSRSLRLILGCTQLVLGRACVRAADLLAISDAIAPGSVAHHVEFCHPCRPPSRASRVSRRTALPLTSPRPRASRRRKCAPKSSRERKRVRAALDVSLPTCCRSCVSRL